MSRRGGVRKRARGGLSCARRRSGPRGRRGFTLVEISLASLVLVVALGGLMSSILSGLRLSETNAENARAHAEVHSRLAGIQGTDLDAAFATYNADPNDDPGGVGTAPGPDFAVGGLAAAEDDPDGFAGEVIFPASWVGGSLQLREDTVDPAFNMPRDLNGDGLVDGQDHADDYVILPVRVRVRWTGASGVRVVEQSLLLVR